MATSKIPVTVRIESTLLARVRACAEHENRTLTNFIETALRTLVDTTGDSPQRAPSLHSAAARREKSRSDG